MYPPPMQRPLVEGGSRLAAWWKMIFSIAFMFSTIYLRLQGKVPPPPTRIELGSKMSQVNEVNECILQSTPLSITYFMPEKETCEFQFHMDI